MIKERLHIAIVMDKNKTFSGIATLEDTIETLLGKEIVDEFDPAVDMRKIKNNQDF